ncbi:hypothetical protein CALCODRAFT_434394, partial [Calocera cornea HHB12733]
VQLQIYDYVLTFEKERKSVWNSQWTCGKALFLVCRYLPFVDFPMWLFGKGEATMVYQD